MGVIPNNYERSIMTNTNTRSTVGTLSAAWTTGRAAFNLGVQSVGVISGVVRTGANAVNNVKGDTWIGERIVMARDESVATNYHDACDRTYDSSMDAAEWMYDMGVKAVDSLTGSKDEEAKVTEPKSKTVRKTRRK